MANDIEIEDRRKFLISCGRFAAVTPPAMTLFLSHLADINGDRPGLAANMAATGGRKRLLFR